MPTTANVMMRVTVALGRNTSAAGTIAVTATATGGMWNFGCTFASVRPPTIMPSRPNE